MQRERFLHHVAKVQSDRLGEPKTITPGGQVSLCLTIYAEMFIFTESFEVLFRTCLRVVRGLPLFNGSDGNVDFGVNSSIGLLTQILILFRRKLFFETTSISFISELIFKFGSESIFGNQCSPLFTAGVFLLINSPQH
ncbi:hypothetical protein NPIL_467811 [Nephila pilipes]|uniref:Uncharacterized protein n=1 Tax=Nephila pilipes TaxID=299642 RepID=A0A8X6NU15_NEPPI|nr:hypothetical protein NPIL_467811 [Nephila pilipes]